MVNLLFISNSTKIDKIKNDLQPFLKVKIDVVSDFDYGLKDVFEKRPATVFIQDQIAGVTGESVARHIQMLLGASAPSFIFMHEDNSKAKPIKGLFEYLIDLSQLELKIVDDIQATLKSLLGPQWEKIYIPPKISPLAKAETVVSEGSRAFADKLVDEFLSDLDGFGSASAEDKSSSKLSEPAISSDEPFLVVSSPQDQLAEMFSETSREQVKTAETIVSVADVISAKMPIPGSHSVVTLQDQQSTSSNNPEAVVSVTATFHAHPHSVLKGSEPAVQGIATKPNAGLVTPDDGSQTDNQPLQTSPADFIIVREKPAEEIAPEDLLRVFEGNYYSHSFSWKRIVSIVTVFVMCIGGTVWYISKHNQLSRTKASKSSVQPDLVTPAVRPLDTPIAAQAPVTPLTMKSESEPSALPSFIPPAGLDSSFASLNPGWERYVDTLMEFRIFRVAGKIKALQVLGAKDHDISEPRLKSILIELVGDGEYRVKSREQKLGYLVSRAVVGQKAELLIYRKKAAVCAFVVSLN